MRSAISALAGLALAGSFAFAQPSDGRLKIIHETATLRVAYRTDSRPFSYVDAQGRPVGYTIELCERIARSLEAQLNVGLTIKWVPVDERTRFDAIVNDTADMECGSTTVSLSRMKIVDFSSVVFADSTGILVKSGKELFTFDNMAGKNIGVIAGTTNARVGSGFVPSLAHPGGNITGFHNFEPELSGKWLEILKEVAPEVRRVAFLHHPQTAAHIGFLRAIEAASNSVGVTITAAGARDASEIEPALTAFAREPNGGVIVAPSPITTFRRELIITLARQLDLPAIYPFRYFPKSGGLVSYGIDQMEQARGGASYIDRVLRGANPGELPVQLPTRYELAINLKTAKTLGLKIPESFLLRADEVIE